MDNDAHFTIGQTFDTYDELKQNFQRFCEKYYHPFVIRSHSNNQTIYKCCHGVRHKKSSAAANGNGTSNNVQRHAGSKATNQRGYFFNGCTAQVNLYKSKYSKWRVTKVQLEHNHTISKDNYNMYHRMNKNKTTGKNTPLSTNMTTASEQSSSSEKAAADLKLSCEPAKVDSNIRATTHLDVVNQRRQFVHEEHILKRVVIKQQPDLSYRERHEQAVAGVQQLADVLAEYETPIFCNYMEELKVIVGNARHGAHLLSTHGHQQRLPQTNYVPKKENAASSLELVGNADMKFLSSNDLLLQELSHTGYAFN